MVTTSVLLPSYRRPAALARCLAALAAQTVLPTEVLVIWQQNDTATCETAEGMALSAPYNLRVVYSPITGIVPAENAGLSNAIGDIVLMTDDDAVPTPAWIDSHLRHYGDSTVGAVGGPTQNRRPDEQPYPTRRATRFGEVTCYGKLIGNLFDHDPSYTGVISVAHLAGNNMSIRRAAFSKFESSLKPYWQYFEADACLQVSARGYRVLYDFDNPVLHFPTNDVFDGTRDGNLALKVLNPAFNHAFLLSKHTPPGLRLLRLAYLLAVGSVPFPGLAAFPIAVKRYGSPQRELRLLFGVMRAHAAGWIAGRRARKAAPMRVLLITKAFAPSIGGVETYTNLLAEGLVRAGVQTSVATLTPRGSHDDSAETFGVFRCRTAFHYLRAMRGADVLHFAGPSFVPLLVAVLFRKKLVVEHHGYQACCVNGLLLMSPGHTVCPEHFVHKKYLQCFKCTRQSHNMLTAIAKVAAAICRRLLCKAGSNIAVTNHVRNRLRLPATEVIYHGIRSAPENTPLGACRSRAGAVVFGYVGRLSGEKGIEFLLQAAAILKAQGKGFEIRIIGDGASRSDLELLTLKLDVTDKVVFLGSLRGANLEQSASQIEAVIMPSICEETAGLVAIEHMLRGRLVLASDIGGLAEIVGEAGLKFAPRDAGALATRMRDVIDNPSIIGEYGVKAHLRATRLFQQDRMALDHLNLYNALLSRS